jgi:uncharacterized protein DUF3667
MMCKVKGYLFFLLPILDLVDQHERLKFMSLSTCLNCGASLDTEAKFCRICGQKTDTHRLTLSHLLHDLFHALTHADKGIFHLLLELVRKPGVVAKEYIAGKRKKYFNPFTFLLILMALFVLSNVYFTHSSTSPQPDPDVLAHIPSEAGKKQYVTMFQRGVEVRVFMARHANIVAMVAIPFFAFLTWSFYARRGFNFAEHLTANLFFVAFSNLAFTLIVYPLLGLAGGSGGRSAPATLVGLGLQVIYLTWCYYQFLPSPQRPLKLMAAFGISVLAIILWVVFTMTVMAIYIYRSWSFVDFFSRMFSS